MARKKIFLGILQPILLMRIDFFEAKTGDSKLCRGPL